MKAAEQHHGSLLDLLRSVLFTHQAPPPDLVEFTRSRQAMTKSAKRLKRALEKEDALSGMVRRMKSKNRT